MKRVICRFPLDGGYYVFDTKANRKRAASMYARLGFNSLVGYRPSTIIVSKSQAEKYSYGLEVRLKPGEKFYRVNC